MAPTPKQKALARAVVENLQKDAPETMGSILEKSGYSEKTALSPRTITETVGFKAALAELGLTEELITSSLVEDIQAKPSKRLPELKLGAEILGMVKREDDTTKTVNNTYNVLFNVETRQAIAQMESVIKAKLLGDVEKTD